MHVRLAHVSARPAAPSSPYWNEPPHGPARLQTLPRVQILPTLRPTSHVLLLSHAESCRHDSNLSGLHATKRSWGGRGAEGFADASPCAIPPLLEQPLLSLRTLCLCVCTSRMIEAYMTGLCIRQAPGQWQVFHVHPLHTTHRIPFVTVHFLHNIQTYVSGRRLVSARPAMCTLFILIPIIADGKPFASHPQHG